MAAFSLAFHGLTRVGELTVGNKSSDTHTISFHDVKISNNILEIFILPHTSIVSDEVLVFKDPTNFTLNLKIK